MLMTLRTKFTPRGKSADTIHRQDPATQKERTRKLNVDLGGEKRSKKQLRSIDVETRLPPSTELGEVFWEPTSQETCQAAFVDFTKKQSAPIPALACSFSCGKAKDIKVSQLPHHRVTLFTLRTKHIKTWRALILHDIQWPLNFLNRLYKIWSASSPGLGGGKPSF